MTPSRLMQSLVLVPLLGMAIVTTTHAGAFDERAAWGRKVEEMPDYKPYFPKMYGAIGSTIATAMKTCTKNIASPDLGPFVLIADIAPNGVAQDVVVSPATNVATCFAGAYSKMPFPKPPKIAGTDSFPVTIDMSIKP